MPQDRSSSHQLRKLREKYSDQALKNKASLTFVSQLGKPNKSTKKPSRLLGKLDKLKSHQQSGFEGRIEPKPGQLQFNSTVESLTPVRHRKIFEQIYTFSFFLLTILFVWIGYRSFFSALPTWFDEGVAKAIVFGLPVVWFASRSRFIASEIGLSQNQFLPGLFLGIAVGGIYGFAGLIMQAALGTELVPGSLFATNGFWWLAFLALLTAWWESLFFFGLPVQYVRSIAPWFSESLLGAMVVGFFILFHIPLRLILTGWQPQFLIQIGLLCLFAIGQYLFYLRSKNMYALVASHLFWGLVLQVYAV